MKLYFQDKNFVPLSNQYLILYEGDSNYKTRKQ